jgi:hypothetical protein
MPVEFSNSINSRKSLFSFIRLRHRDKVQQNIQPLLRAERAIERSIGFFALTVRLEFLCDLLHNRMLEQKGREAKENLHCGRSRRPLRCG